MQQGEAVTAQKGLEIRRYFTKEGIKPSDMFTYEMRTSMIKNPDGSLVFEMNDVEVPEFWSQVATDILAQKYFRKAGVPLRNEQGELLLDESGNVLTGSENSIKQVAHRIAGCWRHWGEKYGYFASAQDAQHFYDEMSYMIINQSAAPNSPQWFTTGLNWAYGLTGPAQGHSFVNPVTKQLEYSKDAYTRSQPHACFIQQVNDDLVRDGGIFSLLTREARIFKYGSGTGSNFSKIRGRGEHLSGGGQSSGLMSFLKIFDTAAGSVKSGGTTRRAAKMCSLDLDHPEIQEFVWWKVREEEKVAHLVAGSKILKKRLQKVMDLAKGKANPLEDEEVKAALREAARDEIPTNYLVRAIRLAKQEYSLPFQEFDTHYESDAYLTVSGQNSNNSVRIPNAFFQALDDKQMWQLTSRTDGSVMREIEAEALWDDIGYCAWACADPGMQYDTTINEWHTCPQGGRINGSNPCSEYMFLDDTACNLASINLIKFYDDQQGVFDIAGFRHAIRLWTIALEISVLMAHFPSDAIAMKSYEYRTLGLGYANIGTLLMLQGIAYDSERGRSIAGAMAAIMTGDAYATSAEMASILGPFERYGENSQDMLRVMRNHKNAAFDEGEYEGLSITPMAIDQTICPSDLLEASHNAWTRAVELGESHGYRNAQTTVIAPTGTIGLVMDCDTTGIEPDYALVKYKKLAGGGFFKIVNRSVPAALRRLGYSEDQVREIIAYCIGRATFRGAPHINYETLGAKGIGLAQIEAIENDLKNSMDIRMLFNEYTLGKERYDQLTSTGQGALEALGFGEDQIREANFYICGTMTLEGAPHLTEEHYSVFDCASPCGALGTRYIHPYGHMKMMAAVQPFISGAISKTINMPGEWNVAQIKQAYYDSWKMMIKAVALYRDGSKLSQVLSSTVEENAQIKALVSEAKTQASPVQGSGVVKTIVKQISKVGAQRLVIEAHESQGGLEKIEVHLNWGSPIQQVMMETILTQVNFSLQAGVNPHELAAKTLNQEGHPVLTALKEFMENYEIPTSGGNVAGGSNNEVSVKQGGNNINTEEEVEKCRECGATQMRQNGTCMLCEVCGSTTGCS